MNGYRIGRPGRIDRRGKNRRKLMPVWKMVVIDTLLIGVFALVFLYFNLASPSQSKSLDEQLPEPSHAITAAPENTDQPSDNNDTPVGEHSSMFLAPGTLSQITEDSYVSENVNLKMRTEVAYSSVIHITEIYVRDVKYLKTAFAGGEYAKARSDSDFVEEIAKKNNAVFAVNGDEFAYSPSRTGVVVRDGVLYRDSLFEDVAVLNYNGTLETFANDEFDLNKVKTEGAWQVWSFGPKLLTNGQPMTKFNSKVNPANPRTAIGMIEPLHYLIITVEGRDKKTDVNGQSIVSKGITTKDLSQWFYDNGCLTAYNLDGGATSSMAFNGETFNSMPTRRAANDIIYIEKE